MFWKDWKSWKIPWLRLNQLKFKLWLWNVSYSELNLVIYGVVKKWVWCFPSPLRRQVLHGSLLVIQVRSRHSGADTDSTRVEHMQGHSLAKNRKFRLFSPENHDQNMTHQNSWRFYHHWWSHEKVINDGSQSQSPVIWVVKAPLFWSAVTWPSDMVLCFEIIKTMNKNSNK